MHIHIGPRTSRYMYVCMFGIDVAVSVHMYAPTTCILVKNIDQLEELKRTMLHAPRRFLKLMLKR